MLFDDDDDLEEFDDENFEDEEEEVLLSPLSKKETALIEADYTEPISDDPVEELKYLLDSYAKLKKLEPEIEYEEQMQAYSMEIIEAVLAEFEIPIDDLKETFLFMLNTERLKEEYSSLRGTPVFKSEDSLFNRVDEFMQEYPDMFCDVEIYDGIFDVPKDLTSTKLYKNVLRMCYEDLTASGTVASLDALLQLYVQKKPLADEFVEKVEIPSESLEEFKESFNLIVNCPRQKGTLKKRFHELKETIQEKYSTDSTLAEWASQQQQKETEAAARNYNLVKWGSLALCVFIAIASLVVDFTLVITGIIVLAVWGVLYYTPLHDKILFLRDGKAAVESLKNK